MKTWIWIPVAWLGVSITTALASRIAPAHVLPDVAIIVICFLAHRREPIPLVAAALGIGYLVGRQALAPVGVHETALVLCATGVYLASGRLAGSGALFFAIVCAAAATAYHVLLFALLLIFREDVGFASWATALLVPSALATAVAGLLGYRPMSWLEAKVSPERREGLSWR